MIQFDNELWQRNKRHYVEISENCFVRKYNNTVLYRDKAGRRHRIDGPARDTQDLDEFNFNEWYINDILCNTIFMFQQLTERTDEEMTIMILKFGDIR